MKCCHYERHLTDINDTFYSDQCILPLFFVIPFYCGGAISSQNDSQVSIQVCHLMWGSTSLYLPSEPCIYTFHTLTHSYLVGRSMVVGHILTVHTCSLMCTNHIDTTAYTPAFLLSQVPLVYMWSTAQLGIVSYHTFGAMPVGWSPIHVLTRLMIA